MSATMPNPILDLARIRVCNAAPSISDRKAELSYVTACGKNVRADAAGWTIDDLAPHVEPKDSSPLTNLQRAVMRVTGGFVA